MIVPENRKMTHGIMQKVILVALIILLSCRNVLLISEHSKLLVVSYDAFRHDYFERNVTPFMNKLRNKGTYADYIMNIFVTKTFPNHHTMATGFYAETHGVVDNNYIDPNTGKKMNYSYELYHYNNKILPIWTVNEKNGRDKHSGSMMWPGGIFEYHGTKPTFAEQFDIKVPWKRRIDTLLSWFVDPVNPINFGVLYIEEPDYHGHAIGIHSTKFNEILRKLDRITEYLHNEIQRHGLDDLNVIHLSDHGMTTVKMDRIINLTNYINELDYTSVGTSPTMHVYPTPGKEHIVYQNLKEASLKTGKFRVYRQDEIPEKYHYGNNPRVGPIFVIAELGYAFQEMYQTIEFYKRKFNITVDSNSEFGSHGYTNEDSEMHPMFFANGPAFLDGCKLQPFNNIDLFPLFCKILDLDCPIVNGTVSHFNKCLRDNRDVSIGGYQIAFILVSGATMVFGILAAFRLFLMRK